LARTAVETPKGQKAPFVGWLARSSPENSAREIGDGSGLSCAPNRATWPQISAAWSAQDWGPRGLAVRRESSNVCVIGAVGSRSKGGLHMVFAADL